MLSQRWMFKHVNFSINLSFHLDYLVINFSIYIYISSSSSCCAAGMDIPDPLSPLLPIVHRLWQVFRHCWRSRDELISDIFLWTPTYGRAGRPARTYIQQLCEDTGCSPEYIYIYTLRKNNETNHKGLVSLFFLKESIALYYWYIELFTRKI